MLCLSYTARILAFENPLNSAWKLHIDFADNLLVFNNVYADARVNKAKHRIININDIINFNPDFVIIAVPSLHIENVLSKVTNKFTTKPIYINVAKGFNQKTLK